MNDIRKDLKQRVYLWEEKVKAANAHFETMVKRLQSERDATVADLKARIATASKLIEFEQQDMGKTAPAETAASPKLSLAAG
jgi:peptidoglycan hydrolase CwlO-like protein